jgi:positive regulator of sigma E activity
MNLNLLFYKLSKFALFFAIVYTILTQSLKQENHTHVLRLVLIIVLAFVVIDCYYPTISYE